MTKSLWLQLLICVLLFILIVLGAGVRLADAGLACPDWPLCFGQVVPLFDFKIFMEWIHRAIAGGIGLMALVTSTSIFYKPNLRRHLGLLSAASLLLFLFQAWLGGQTVIQLLRAEIVTAHLFGGYLLFAANLWIFCRWKALSVDRNSSELYAGLSFYRGLLWMSWLLVFCQAILGALVSSHYAGHACPDFPLCHGRWIPTFASDEIVLHFLHRCGAVLVLGVGVCVSWRIRGDAIGRRARRLAGLALVLIVLQWVLGISMIFTRVHPGASIFHSLGSLSIFTVYLWLLIHASPKPKPTK